MRIVWPRALKRNTLDRHLARARVAVPLVKCSSQVTKHKGSCAPNSAAIVRPPPTPQPRCTDISYQLDPRSPMEGAWTALPGDAVEIHSLEKRADLNGKTGRVLRCDEESQRSHVQVDASTPALITNARCIGGRFCNRSGSSFSPTTFPMWIRRTDYMQYGYLISRLDEIMYVWKYV